MLKRKPMPERYIKGENGYYYENPEYTKRMLIANYGYKQEDMDQAAILFKPEFLTTSVITHQAYLALLRIDCISEDNEFDLSSKFDEIRENLMFYEQLKGFPAGKGVHSEAGKEAAREILQLLWQNEGDSEIFPYDFADELSREFGIDNPF